MAELKFDREPEGTPFDRDQELTEWLVVDTVPTVADGDRFPARDFTAGGYRATDGKSLFTGLQGISAHLIIAPDYTSPETRQALLYRGHGGPTAPEYWAWGIEIERSGTVVTVYSVHQDQGGVFIEQLIGTFDVAGEWIALAVSRETTPGGFEARAWLDGEDIGTVTTATSTASTPGQPVTLGCRIIAAETSERVFQGRIERVLVKESAATNEEVAFEFDALVSAFPDAYATWSSYLPSSLARTRESVYGRYRVRPTAEMLAPFDAAVRRWQVAALPPGAYGPQLEALEGALSLSPQPTDTIAARQAAAQAAIAGVTTITPQSMQELAAILFGVPTVDVTILEGRNYADLQLAGTGELTGPPWRVRGPVDATNQVGGMQLDIPAGRDLRYAVGVDRAVFVELAIGHDPDGRETDHGLAVTIDSATGLQEDTWAGIALVEPGHKVWWIALDSGGLVQRSYDLFTGLSDRTVLDGTVSAPLEIVVEWIQEPLPAAPLGVKGRWDIRWRTPGTGPGNWSEISLVTPTGKMAWFGMSVSSALTGIVLDVAVLVSAVTAKAGDSPAWAYWQAFDLDPVNRDIVAHSTELDRKGRAVSHGSATYQPELFADTDGAAWSFTPTTLFGPRVGHIGDTAADAAQSTSIFPDSLWLFQASDEPIIDRVASVDISEPPAITAPTYQAAGPADRFAVEFAANNNALIDAAGGSFDVSGNAVFLACILRITGNGVILGKEQTGVIGWVLQKNAGNMTLRVGDGIGTATATFTDAASGFVVDQWFALALVVKDDAGTGRVWLATSQGSTSGSAVLATSNTGRLALGAGASGSAAVHRQRWATATAGGEADAITLSGLAKIAARLSAAAGVS